MSDIKRPTFAGPGQLGPLPRVSAPHLANGDDEPQTNPSMTVSAGYVKAKLEEAQTEAQRRTWFAGWAAGIAGVGAAVILAFGGWFKIEAMAQEKADHAVQQADAGADRKLAPIATDIALLKNDVASLKETSKKDGEQHEEIIRLLKARR